MSPIFKAAEDILLVESKAFNRKVLSLSVKAGSAIQ